MNAGRRGFAAVASERGETLCVVSAIDESADSSEEANGIKDSFDKVEM